MNDLKHKIPGVTDELLSNAKEEFLHNGYSNASLRKIASESGVSTNSIYGRFHDKAGLFDALVKEDADELYRIFEESCQSILQDPNLETSAEIENSNTHAFIDYIYDHFDCFQLIFCKSTGTKYENYVDQLSCLEEETYKTFIQEIGKASEVDDFFIHAVVSSGYKYLVEIVEHHLSREEAYVFMDKISEFRMAGWQKILEQ